MIHSTPMIFLTGCRLLYFDCFYAAHFQDRGMGTELDSRLHFFHRFIKVLYSPGPLSR